MSAIQTHHGRQPPAPPNRVIVTVYLPSHEFESFAQATEALSPVAEELKQALEKYATELIADKSGYRVKAEVVG